MITAMTWLASDSGVATVTVADVVRLAGVSRRTFYEVFKDRDECALAAFDHGLALASARAEEAYAPREPWVQRVRAGLTALLQLFDEEPELARLCVVQSAAAGGGVLERRGEILGQLARVVDQGRALARRPPAPLTAEGVVGGVLSVVASRLTGPDAELLIDLLNPLMSMIVLPYLGTSAAHKELSRPVPQAPVSTPVKTGFAVLEGLPMRVTYRTLAVLNAISVEPGLNNREVSDRAGIADQGQISKLLHRLSQLGLIENAAAGERQVSNPNAWRLTVKGTTVEETIRSAFRVVGANGATQQAA